MLNDLKSISISEISERTGFSPDDILAECQNRGIAPIHLGYHYYLTADMLPVLFSQDSADIFVTNQPICSTAIDKRLSAELELSQRYGKEVKRVANATISFVSKEGRKKPFLVQRRVYFEDGSNKRVSKCFATREEAYEYAAVVNSEREQSNSKSESVHIEPTANSRQALGLSDYSRSTGINNKRAVGGDMRFYDYMLYYINESEQCTCGYDTKRCYITAANQIQKQLKALGCDSIRLNEIDDTVLNKVTSGLIQSELSQSSLNKVYIVITMVLRYANCKGYTHVYTDLIRKGKSIVKEQERPPYSDEELELIFAAAKSDIRFYAFLAIALYTGMRPSEIRALKWCDIDFVNNVVRVTKAMKRIENKDQAANANGKKPRYVECVGKTKSDKGVRPIPLSVEAAKILAVWKEESRGTEDSFLFPNRRGGALTDSGIHDMWYRFLKKNRFDHRGFMIYRYRHTFCTHLLKKYLPQKVQLLMGDSSTSVIMKNYNGLCGDDVMEEMRGEIDAIFHIE